MPPKNRSIFTMRDWRKSLGISPAYHRMGGHSTTPFRFQMQYVLLTICFVTLLLILLYMKPSSSPYSALRTASVESQQKWPSSYNSLGSGTFATNQTYPLTAPILSSDGLSTAFRIGMIADLDQQSAKTTAKNTWRSYLMRGRLAWTPATRSVSVQWDAGDPTEVTHQYALKGRGMELSELVTFNGRLLTVDDRTGFVYEIVAEGKQLLPWVVLMDGDGRSPKGFKSEWATVKDDMLWVGSMGKEWTTASGAFETNDPMWVKAITSHGHVHNINWVENFKKIRSAIGIQWPGYMIHEAAMWSAIQRKWYFLPRRCSKETYNETRDEHMGCNVLISADEDFRTVAVVKLGDVKPSTHGFSSFKFLPGTDDRIIVALLTEELNGKTSTFITAFDTNGETLLPQQQIPTTFKYEGLEFI